MAIPVQPSLAQLRESLLARLGLASAGSVPDNIAPVLDERIRQAQTKLLTQFDMTRLWTLRDYDIVPGVSEYDWPDKVEIGDLKRVCVVRADDGQEWELQPGMRPNERSLMFPSPTNDPTAWGMPRLYTLQNQVLRIGPAPDESWGKLRLEFFESGNPLVDDGDLCSADPEALLMSAEVLMRQHLGMPGWEPLQASLKEYLLDLQGKQGDGDGFQMGGRQSIRNLPQIRNRAADPVYGYRFGAGQFGRHLSW